MKTLVIHPKDSTTNFLSEIYSDKDWTIINSTPSKKYLKEQIKAHDRIVMLGHGSEKGLFGLYDFIIDQTLVYLLREKICVCIWCHADEFVKKYKLSGIYTGMIVSDMDETELFINYPVATQDITESNELFANTMKILINTDVDFFDAINNYNSNGNQVISFNRERIFKNI